MGDHIVRRGAAGSGARRTEPRPTAELGNRELQSLIRDQASGAAPADLEAELEISTEAPARLPASSSPRLLAHTLRREPTPDGTVAAHRPPTPPPAAEAAPADPATIFDRDVSTIAMPRLERPDAMDAVPSEPLASESAHTVQLRHGRGACTDFDDDPVPPAADDFDNGHPVTDLALARGKRRTADAVAMRALKPSIPPTARIDRELAAKVALPPPPLRVHPRAPAGRILRVLPITLSILVAVVAAYLLLHSGL